ncbi:MAG: secondary thiamine-phosphate synthase [Bacteroidetes bacterium GWC2_33_15]|nr:MAG: secondary thiamine-phosphate synthase [Bacteroidetes bacterium GWA2_33_15]OFX52221.1 MAG: secondary thiamine-phosphate synthase [Bacteroidetes bacterium GWC2_33_15]OFX64375.1 MAG: secondary thiamine-phosphate synthase [Bacteroidetes bacterium GWB2_32_14]OFX67780.1 MAG: secondary thiamine-phosphate synthase [Bacteroidetes bacterium GWD2_33_33]HAN19392.1 secondary thiamine-phosphate synthase [Bacteroidales bacterium]
MITQKEITLPSFKRGFHLITSILLKEIDELPEKGILHVFIKHTSAGLTINENADPTVTHDFDRFMNHLIPDGDVLFKHTSEGDDDMPAHVKSSVFGQSVTIPVTNHKLNLGIWQGIYLCEFRNNGGNRKIVLTVYS